MILSSPTAVFAACIQPKLGFVFEGIILEIFFSLLTRCVANALTPAAYLRDHYDSSTDTFDQNTSDRALVQLSRSIRQSHRQNGTSSIQDFTTDQLRQVVHHTLFQAMTSPKEVVTSVMASSLLIKELPDVQ